MASGVRERLVSGGRDVGRPAGLGDVMRDEVGDVAVVFGYEDVHPAAELSHAAQAVPNRNEKIPYESAPMSAEAGIVSSQAQTIWPATPQRTAEVRRVDPTPTIAPVIVWVVLMPTPASVAP